MVKKKVIEMVYRKRTQVQAARCGEKKSTLNNSLRALNVITNATGTFGASSQEPAYKGISAETRQNYDLDMWKAKAVLAARNQLFR